MAHDLFENRATKRKHSGVAIDQASASTAMAKKRVRPNRPVSQPVIGVPIDSSALKGMDALLSTVQMPPGVPVATVAIGNARNAGLLAARIIGAADPGVQARLAAFRGDLRQHAIDKGDALKALLRGG